MWRRPGLIQAQTASAGVVPPQRGLDDGGDAHLKHDVDRGGHEGILTIFDVFEAGPVRQLFASSTGKPRINTDEHGQ